MSDIKSLVERLRARANACMPLTSIAHDNTEAADLIEQQAALIEANRVERVQLHDRIDILDRRIAELEKDAERYRWLREATYDAAMPVMFDYDGPAPMVFLRRSTVQLDRAIDAALAASEPKKD